MYLALDTATDRPTLALGTASDPGGDRIVAHRHDLSRDIDRVVRELMAARGVGAEALAGVVVADGPGSFTGLRIGIAFAKGLCRARGIPLLASPSLLGAARVALEGDGLVAVDYDALRGQVYRAVYRFGTGVAEVVQAPALASPGAPVPDGAARAGAEQASASALLSLVGVRGGPQRVADPGSWEPAYGRPAEAEARRLASHAPR
jgi:tRNA threonylcarbamoyl adenosine modification protein YeaZ